MKAKIFVLTVALLLAVCPAWLPAQLPTPTPPLLWMDQFESYEVGSDLHGQGGWVGWDDDPSHGALAGNIQKHSGERSVEIVGAGDLVHEYSGYTSGGWTYTAWQYLPEDFSGRHIFIMLSQYSDPASRKWSVQVSFDAAGGQVYSNGDGEGMALIKGGWSELRLTIDLEADIQRFYYDGRLLYEKSWTEGESTGGFKDIAAVDLYANESSVVYYDDMSLLPGIDPPPSPTPTPNGYHTPIPTSTPLTPTPTVSPTPSLSPTPSVPPSPTPPPSPSPSPTLTPEGYRTATPTPRPSCTQAPWPGIRITHDGAVSDQSQPAVDSRGNIHLTWSDDRGGADEIYYSMLDGAGNTLIDDTLITADDGLKSKRPTLVVDSLDKVHIVWQDKTTSELLYTKIDPYLDDRNGDAADKTVITLIKPKTATSIGEGMIGHPQISLDSDNNIHLVGEDTWDYECIRYTRLDSDGNILNPTQTILGGYIWRSAPDVAVDFSDNVHIIWNDYGSTCDAEIYYLMFDNTGNELIGKTRLTVDDCCCSKWQSVSVGPDDKIYIVWQDGRGEGGGGETEIYFMKLDPSLDDQNGDAADPDVIKVINDTPLTPIDGIKSTFPISAVDNSGNIHLTWYETWLRDNLHYKKVSGDGTVLEDDILISRSTTTDTMWTLGEITVDNNDNAHVTWTDNKDGNLEIYYARIPAPPTPTPTPEDYNTPTPTTTPTPTPESYHTPTPTLTPGPTATPPAASFPFYDGFESGVFGPVWTVFTGQDGQRVRVSDSDPHAGNYCAVLGSGGTYGDYLTYLNLTADLQGQSQVDLDFWWRATDSSNLSDDGIFVSDDYGGNWHRIFTFIGRSEAFAHAIIDLDQAAAAEGFTLNNHLQLKFQFRDNTSTSADGYLIDEIRILRGITPTPTPEGYQAPSPTPTPPVAAFPFYDGFESGSLGLGWSVFTSNGGRVRVSADYPAAGSYGVLLDDAVTDLECSRSALILTIDLAGRTETDLSFRARDFWTENTWDNGLFISDDYGSNWYRIFPFMDLPSWSYGTELVDLAAAAVSKGLILNDHFQIKFQFFDNGSIPNDGYGLDEVRIPAQGRTPTPTPESYHTPTPTPGLPVIYSFPLDAAPGWTMESGWAFGQPTGGGGGYGNPDPASAYTGSNVYGYNLSGDYPNSLPAPSWLTTSALDCSRLTDTHLRFRRWLNVESAFYDHGDIEVSSSGTSWIPVWQNPNTTITDSDWSQVEYDISSIADGQAVIYLRWGMGPTDTSWQYSGWNIDDIEICGFQQPSPSPAVPPTPTPPNYKTPTPPPTLPPTPPPTATASPTATAPPTVTPTPTPEGYHTPSPTLTPTLTPPTPTPTASPTSTPTPTTTPYGYHTPTPTTTPPPTSTPTPAENAFEQKEYASIVLTGQSAAIPIRVVNRDVLTHISSVSIDNCPAGLTAEITDPPSGGPFTLSPGEVKTLTVSVSAESAGRGSYIVGLSLDNDEGEPYDYCDITAYVVDQDLPDLQITNESVEFSYAPGPPQPVPLESEVTILATVENVGNQPCLEDIAVEFRELITDQTIGTATIPGGLAAGDSFQVSVNWTAWSEAGYALIQTTVAAVPPLEEITAENNVTSHILQVGDLPPGSATIEVVPFGYTENVVVGGYGSVAGNAYYRIEQGIGPVVWYPVKGGLMTAALHADLAGQPGSLEGSHTAHSGDTGSFFKRFPVPGEVGSRHWLKIKVTDGTLVYESGYYPLMVVEMPSFPPPPPPPPPSPTPDKITPTPMPTGSVWATPTPLPTPIPPSRNVYIHSEDIEFTDPQNGSYYQLQETVRLKWTFHYEGPAEGSVGPVPVRFYAHLPSVGTEVLGPPMMVDFPSGGPADKFSVMVNWTNGAEGAYIIEGTAEFPGPVWFNDDSRDDRATRALIVGSTYPLTGYISCPAEGEVICGVIEVVGIAAGDTFDNYLLEYGEGSEPSSWQLLRYDQTPVSNDWLGEWNMSGLSGLYSLRLTVSDGGDEEVVHKIEVEVCPPTPTPTPSVIPTPTSSPIPPATPSPVATPTVSPSPVPVMTPSATPTISPTPVPVATPTPTIPPPPPTPPTTPSAVPTPVPTATATPPSPVLVYFFPLDEDPGWSMGPGWEFDLPRGRGGASWGNPDPTGAYSGDKVYGYDLTGDGDYPCGLTVTHWLTTAPLDCSRVSGTYLKFWRWLNVERNIYDHAYLEVSADGQSWTRLWANESYWYIMDSGWSQFGYDLSAVADGEPSVYIRWGMGPTDDYVGMSGWNLDDIEIWSIPPGMSAPTPAPTPARTPTLPVITPTPEDWDKSSLVFESGCDGGCELIRAEVINAGDGDMAGPSDWELYWVYTGNPRQGEVIAAGQLGPLSAGQSEILSYDPAQNPFGIATGNYMFQAVQRPGHPGTGEVWSDACEVICSSPFLAAGDYDGDGYSDVAVYRAATGLWAIRSASRFYFGTDGDIPVSADYDGDGTADFAVYRPSTNLWVVRRVTRFYYGQKGDIPVPADYDGNGTCEIAIFRRDSGTWAMRDLTRLYFGTVGDLPVPGDYDGDITADVTVFRPSSGLWAMRNLTRLYFGVSSDILVPCDYSGDGVTRAGVFRPTLGLWAVMGVTRFYYGTASDLPIPADFNGDNSDDLGIFRAYTGLWSIRGITRTYYGSSGDLPVTR